MPSLSHELLPRQQPTLAADLVREALGSELPKYTAARVDSADLTDIQPTEYRADLVVVVLREQPVVGIVVEVQLSRDPDKPFTWPVYVTTLRARIRCPTRLLVVTAKEHVAHWARTALEVGGGLFVPWVLGLPGWRKSSIPSKGKAEGEAEGRTEIVLRLLTYRFGPLSKAELDRVRNADSQQLNAVAERLLQAATLQEALGSLDDSIKTSLTDRIIRPWTSADHPRSILAVKREIQCRGDIAANPAESRPCTMSVRPASAHRRASAAPMLPVEPVMRTVRVDVVPRPCDRGTRAPDGEHTTRAVRGQRAHQRDLARAPQPHCRSTPPIVASAPPRLTSKSAQALSKPSNSSLLPIPRRPRR